MPGRCCAGTGEDESGELFAVSSHVLWANLFLLKQPIVAVFSTFKSNKSISFLKFFLLASGLKLNIFLWLSWVLLLTIKFSLSEFGVHLAELTVDPQGALAIRQVSPD